MSPGSSAGGRSPSSARGSIWRRTGKGPDLKKAFGGVYIVNESFDEKTAEEVLAKGEADAVAFGKLFIANPDLPAALRRGREAQ